MVSEFGRNLRSSLTAQLAYGTTRKDGVLTTRHRITLGPTLTYGLRSNCWPS